MLRSLLLAGLLVLPACPRPTLMCMVLEEYDPTDGSCRRLPEGPRIWHPIDTVATDDALFVFGSYHAMRFDLKDGSWNNLESPPEFGSVEVRAFSAGKTFLVFGERELQSFDPVKGEWRLLAQIPSKRWYYGAAMLGGKVYIAGGDIPDGVTAELLIYDPATDKWAAGRPMKRARTKFALEAAGGRLFAIGGQYYAKEESVPVLDVESYDPAADAWTDTGSVDLGHQWYRPAAAVLNGRILLFQHFGKGADRAVHEFDPQTGKWARRAAEKLIRRSGGEAVASGNRILLVGGFSEDYYVVDTPDGNGRAVFR